MLKPNPAVGKEFSSGSIILTASGESRRFRAILCADYFSPVAGLRSGAGTIDCEPWYP